MQHAVLQLFTSLLLYTSATKDFYYPNNVSRTTKSGIAEYRSALTLDWLAAEDTRQRELALAYETEATLSAQVIASNCITYPKPASGKVARLMLELLKNLEGDEGSLIPELIQALVRSKVLVETSMLEAEPDLESLVKTSSMMMGEPHTTFPRVLAVVWMAATDPTTVNKNGWCPLTRITKYLMLTSPTNIARHMRNIDAVIARARFIMEEFIQHVTPNMYDKRNHDFIETTAIALQHSPASRSNLRIHVRPKMHPYRIKKTSTTASTKTKTTATAPRVKDIQYVDDKHVLVHRPAIVDERHSSAGVVQLSVCLLLCNLAVVCLCINGL